MLRLTILFATALTASFSLGCVTVTTEDGEVVTRSGRISDSRLETLDEQTKRYPKRHDLHYEIAQIHFQNGDFHASAAALSRAIDLAPDVSRYHYDLGRVYLRSAEFDKAERAFREATKLIGDRYTGPRAALGYVLAMEKKFDEARLMFEKCIELEPQNVEYYYYLGSIYDIQGRFEDAIRCYREYLERGGVTYQRKAMFLLEKLGEKVDPSTIANGESNPPQGAVEPGEIDFGPVSQVTPPLSEAR